VRPFDARLPDRVIRSVFGGTTILPPPDRLPPHVVGGS